MDRDNEKTCCAIIRYPDGITWARDYESFEAMRGDARRAKEYGATVLYWWCEMSELKGGK